MTVVSSNIRFIRIWYWRGGDKRQWGCRKRQLSLISEFGRCVFRTLGTELDMDWIHPWIGLDWIGSEVFFDKFVM